MDAEGLTHDGNSELSDAFSIVKTKTRLATKSTVIHQLASSAKLLERLADFRNFEFSPDLVSVRDSRTKNPSCALIRSLGGASSSSEAPQSIVRVPNQEVQQIPMDVLPDIVVLYWTLVADGGLPPGYENSFSALGPVLETAAQRQDRRFRELSNMERGEDIGGSVSAGCGDAASQVEVPSATQLLRGPDILEEC